MVDLKIKSIKFNGLYSYGDQTHICFPEDVVVVAGPNNAGKSNIFRLIEMIANTLTDNRRLLQDYEVFSKDVEPEVEFRFVLTAPETNRLIDYLSFYEYRDERNSGIHHVYEFQNRDRLVGLLDDITVHWKWGIRSVVWGGREPRSIRLTFNKLGLTLASDGFFQHFYLEVGIAPNNHELAFREMLNSLKTDNPVVEIQSFLSQGKANQRSLVINYFQSQSEGNMDEREKRQLESFLNFIGETKPITGVYITFILGLLMKRSLYYASGKRNFVPGDLDYDTNLRKDGSNLPQYLFSLKSSADLDKRERFYDIRQAFEEVIQSERLSFDVIISYEREEDKEPNNYEPKDLKLKAVKSDIVVVSRDRGTQYKLDNAGSGLGEIIFLLSLSHGVRDGIILYDEPASNLYPLQMKSLMNKLLKDNEQRNNMFVIITHSSDLTSLMIFDESCDLLYVNKLDGKSVIKSADEEVKLWLKKEKSKLKYLIDTKLFFGKKIILTEGESDRNFLIGCSMHFGSINRELDLDNNNVLIVNAQSKDNFPKYKQLLDAYEIPYVILGDGDIQNGSRKSLEKIFNSCSYLTKEGIKGINNKIFLVRPDDLESLMKEISPEIYEHTDEDLHKEYGRFVPKPVLAAEFAKRATSSNPEALDPIRHFLQKVLSTS